MYVQVPDLPRLGAEASRFREVIHPWRNTFCRNSFPQW